MPLPTDSSDHPEEVTTYLPLGGEGMEVSPHLQERAGNAGLQANHVIYSML